MLKRIFNFCKIAISSSPVFFILNILFLLIIALSRIGMSYSFKFAADTIMSFQGTGRYNIQLALPILLFFLMICIGGNTQNFENMMTAAYTNKAKKMFAKLFLYRSYQTKQDDLYNNKFYDNYQFVKSNIDNTSQITVTIFNKFTMAVFSLLLSGAAISYFDPVILIFIFLLSIILVFINRYTVKKRMELNEAHVNDERHAKYYSDLLSMRAHAKELRIFKISDICLQKWEKYYKKYTVSKYSFEAKAAVLSNVSNFLQLFMTYGLTLYFLYLIYKGELSVGNFVFLKSVMWSLIRGINGIVDILTKDLSENYQYALKYEEFTGKASLSELKKASDYTISISENMPEFESLTFKNVSYRYPSGDKNAVENLNFTLNKGEVVSLLGYNGSGKSSFSKLMCGLLEDYTGTIKLNGKDIKTYPKEDLFRYFGIGFQDFSKYSISLKENIAVGMVEKFDDEQEIKKAVEKGSLSGLIDKLPNGIDTILGKEMDKEGRDLSGGQWQRVILSRAYMGEPNVLILDEPTASIDPVEEMRMLNRFRGIVKGKTALLISHRIGFARMSDRICIMDSGHIVESGTHDELIKLNGKYYELFTSQEQLYKDVKKSA